MKPFLAGESVATQTMSDTQGIALGSSILTLEGEMPVEFLSPGDRVITRDTGMAVLKSVRAVKLRSEMIAIMGGSLGHNKPEDDTLLPAGQKVLLRDWRAEALYGKPQALATARELVDGEFIRSVGTREVTLYILEFDAPHILYVDGLELACEPEEALSAAAA